MLKMYHDAVAAGGSAAFWESAWDDGRFEESVRFCQVDPLRPIFERYARPGCVLLEGGCGRGNYVAYHSGRGVRAVGVDFATRTLAELRAREPGLRLAAADVAALPLRSGSIDVYYSGGVVEHFESGPSAALEEARRVLAPGGVFLVSVPYFNPLRRALARMGRRDWRVVDRHQAEPADPSLEFFQYVYTPSEFGAILSDHGFDVIHTQGYSILWGLYELPVAGRVLSRAARATTTEPDPGPSVPPSADGSGPEPRMTMAKRLAVSEDTSVPVAGLAVRLLRHVAANMMMYVCVPSASPASGGDRVASLRR